MQVLTVKKDDKLLIVAPHPDDECIGVGGILSCYPDLCTILVLTDGRQGQGHVPPREEMEIRRKEFVAEMDAIGIERYQMLGYEDGTLMQHTDCMCSIPLSDYTKIFVTGIHDNHPDHTAACLSVYQALQYQGIQDTEIYLYEVHAPIQRPTHMLDITHVIDRKMELIRFHKSQLMSRPYDLLAKSMAEYRAIQNRRMGEYLEVYAYRKPIEHPRDDTVELEEKLQKQILFYWMLPRWVDNKIKGYDMGIRLGEYGFRSVAVYGYAELGKLLCRELRESNFEVAYVLDKRVLQTEWETLPIYMPQKGLPEVDAVVVTAVYYFDEVRKELLGLGFRTVISLRELLESGRN